jgi:hypothetical protein
MHKSLAESEAKEIIDDRKEAIVFPEKLLARNTNPMVLMRSK